LVHKEAIVLASSEVLIDNLEFKHGSVGVNNGAAGDQPSVGSGATVVNSRFKRISIGGVLVQCTHDSKIAHNELDNNENGVSTNPAWDGRVGGLAVEANSFQHRYVCVLFLGTGDSFIEGIFAHDKAWKAISLEEQWFEGRASRSRPGRIPSATGSQHRSRATATRCR
jgi:hypothetical protein